LVVPQSQKYSVDGFGRRSPYVFLSDFRFWHKGEAEGGKASSAFPRSSDVNLFSYGEGVIDFNAEIARCPRDLIYQ
jgi:hypothetical protein